MRIPKIVFTILAMTTIIFMTGQPVALAMEEGLTWPTEPDVRGAVKTPANFTLHEISLGYNPTNSGNCPYDHVTEMYMFLRVRKGNSWTWDLITAKAEGTYCGRTGFLDLTKQLEILNFLNSPDVVNAVCPDCEGVFVHLKRVSDDVWNYEELLPQINPESEFAAIADFELVVNQTPPDWP